MPAQPEVKVTLVTLDGDVVDPESPLLYADDVAALRGDGVFETLLVREGAARLVDAHLQRLAHSARLMDLPAPDPSVWRHVIDVAVRHWGGADEGALRLIYSRGRERDGQPTGYAMISPLPGRVAAARRDGVAALTLDRGLAAAGSEEMPWLLAGAKTLSYATNMAVLRYAAKRGADDVIFISSDGYVLEGPRSTVVACVEPVGSGRPCLLTPPTSYRILRGTTQQALFDVAAAHGYDYGYRSLTEADLLAAQDVWLVSSVTLAARVQALDGLALASGSRNAEFAALVDAAIAER